MPSLAKALEIHEEDAQAVGTWQDVPRSSMQSGFPGQRAVSPVMQHFASGTARYPSEL